MKTFKVCWDECGTNIDGSRNSVTRYRIVRAMGAAAAVYHVMRDQLNVCVVEVDKNGRKVVG